MDNAPASGSVPAYLNPAILAVFLVVTAIFTATGDWYHAFKMIHVIFALIWIGGGFLLTILGLTAERTNDPAELATVAKQAATVGEKLFTPAALFTLLSGIAMMLNIDWGWSTFWVLFGLLGFAFSFAVGVGVLTPLSKQARQIAMTSGPTSPEAVAVTKKILLVARFDMAVLLLVVVDMAVKPWA